VYNTDLQTTNSALDTGFIILDLIASSDGTLTLKDIANHFYTLFPEVDRDALNIDIATFVKQLQVQQYVEAT
jgi:hypothetical protein